MVGRDDVICGGLILRCPLLQYVLNFIDEGFGPCQRGALIVTANSLHNRLDRGRQPKYDAMFLQRVDILRAKYGPSASIDYEVITIRKFSADIGF